MKSLILIVSAMIISAIGYSQISKGTCLLGGDFSLSNTSTSASDATDKTSNFAYTILPNFGYMFNKSWEAGLGLGINGNTTKSNGEAALKNFQFNVQPFVSYYHPFREESKFYCKLTGGANLGLGTEKEYDVTDNTLRSESTSSGVDIAISPGIAWAPVKHFMFGADYGSLGYSLTSTKYDQESGAFPLSFTNTESIFGFNLNPSSLIFAFDYLF